MMCHMIITRHAGNYLSLFAIDSKVIQERGRVFCSSLKAHLLLSIHQRYRHRRIETQQRNLPTLFTTVNKRYIFTTCTSLMEIATAERSSWITIQSVTVELAVMCISSSLSGVQSESGKHVLTSLVSACHFVYTDTIELKITANVVRDCQYRCFIGSNIPIHNKSA